MSTKIKKFSTVMLILASMQVFSQVGVGTQNPQDIFHVDAAKDNPTAGVPTDAQALNDFIVNSSGNVGIGTLSPTAKLEVLSNDASNTLFVKNTGGGVGTQPALRVLMNANSALRNIAQFENSVGVQALIKDNGNVGIGTTNPFFKLQIEGNDSGGTTRALIRNSSATANSSADFLAQNNAGSNIQIGINSSTSTAANIYTGVSGTSSYVRTTSGPLYALAVNGGVFLAQGATAWSSTSDKRTKKNILKLENGLSKLTSLSGYTYNYNFDNEKEPRRVGLMAQEVQQVLPEAVSVNNDGILSIRYTELTPLIIEAVKDLKIELDAKNKELMKEKTNNELFQEKTMKELTQQKTMIDNLINEIKAIKSQLNNR